MCRSPRVVMDRSQISINPFVSETTEAACIFICIIITDITKLYNRMWKKVKVLYSHMLQLYTYACRIHIDAIIKTNEDFFKKIYLSLYLKGLRVRGSWRPNRTTIYWPTLLWPSALCLFRSPGLLNRRPGDPICWVRVFSTTTCL